MEKIVELSDLVGIIAVRTTMGQFDGTLKDIASYDLGDVSLAWIIKQEQEHEQL